MSSDKQEIPNGTNGGAEQNASEASKSGRELQENNNNNNNTSGVKETQDGHQQEGQGEDLKKEENSSLGGQGNGSEKHINNQESEKFIGEKQDKSAVEGNHNEDININQNANGNHGGRDFQQIQGSSSESQFDVKYSTINHYYNSVKERKQAELDSQSLANRISLLKQEEVRTLKKIEETRKKAMEIYYLKLKNQKKQSTKQAVIQAELTKKREKVAGQRAMSQEQKRTNKEMYETMKLENVKKLKEMKLNNERKIQMNRQQNVYEAHKRNENVKMQRDNRQKKMEEFQNWKSNNIKRETEEKALYEERVKEQKIKEMKRMEMLEMDIIQRLQSTQMMQKNAYEELESALLLNTQDFFEKYLKKEESEGAAAGAVQGQPVQKQNTSDSDKQQVQTQIAKGNSGEEEEDKQQEKQIINGNAGQNGSESQDIRIPINSDAKIPENNQPSNAAQENKISA